MIERPHLKDGKDNGYLIMTEATVRVETPQGYRRCPAGTMFHVGATRKMRSGTAVEGNVATESTGYYNVTIHWAIRRDKETCENEGSLRRKIMKAENRRWWWRSLVIGAAGGVTLEALSLVPLVDQLDAGSILMSISESKRRTVFRRAGGRCQCRLDGCSHTIDPQEALRRATAAVEGGPIAAALLSAMGDRCSRTFSYPDSLSLLGDLIRGWEVDHITPVSRHGSDDILNLQLLCKECHREKTRRDRAASRVPKSDRS